MENFTENEILESRIRDSYFTISLELDQYLISFLFYKWNDCFTKQEISVLKKNYAKYKDLV